MSTITGNFLLVGTIGDDTITAGAGNYIDWLIGHTGSDTLSGGDGNDILAPDGYSYWFDGYYFYADNYWAAYDDGVADYVDGGGGFDRIALRFDGVTADISADFSDSSIMQTLGYGTTIVNVEQFQIRLGSGNDTLTLGLGNDVVFGGAGNDVINGNDGSDSLYGEDGNDTLNGGGGDDYMDGGSGDDTLDGGDGVDRVQLYFWGSTGVTYTLNDGPVTTAYGIKTLSNFEGADMWGSEGADTLAGGSSTDIIFGYGGDDTLNGLAGNDVLHGMDGNDTLNGGDGNDTLYGGYYDDYYNYDYYGGSDTLNGGAGDDRLYGGYGDDTLDGGDGNDQLYGDGYYYNYAGNDTLSGGAGDDRLEGGGGVDRLDGGDGTDRLNGGDGNDTVVFSGARADYAFEASNQWVKVTNTATGEIDYVIYAETFEFSDQTVPVGDVFTSIINGTEGGDWLPGSYVNDTINGGDGNDTLYGYEGDDTLNGGAGDDWIDSGTGDDTLDGGDGVDRTILQFWNNAGGVTYTLNDGPVVTYTGTKTLSNFEGADMYGSEYGDTLTGGSATDRLFGNGGDDVLNGLGGDDWLEGGYGNDALDGGDGVDRTALYFYGLTGVTYTLNDGPVATAYGTKTLSNFEGADMWGSEGADTLAGGSSTDIIFGYGGDDTLNGLAGNDVLHGMDGNDTLNGGDGNDTLYGGYYDDYYNYDYYGGSDTLNGGAGDDRLYGGYGDDTLVGGDGNDQLYGDGYYYNYAGNDTLSGGAGDDWLDGRWGNDVLDGGDGVDRTRLDFSNSAAGVAYTLNDGPVATSYGTKTLSNFEGAEMVGSQYDDTLTGGSSTDNLYGNNGNDTLNGLGGDDWLDGGWGDDTLNGGDGIDHTALYFYGITGGVTYALNDGPIATYYGTKTLSNFEGANLYGSADNDTLTGGSAYDYIDGQGGDDVLNGLGGDDVLAGWNWGNTRLNGGEGNDTLYGNGASTTAAYSGPRSQYQLVQNNDGSVTVTDTSGSEGADTLWNVSFLQFSTGTISMDDALSNSPPEAPTDSDPTGDTATGDANVAETLTVGSVIGITAQSTDPDGDGLTYFFRDDDGNATQAFGNFAIDESTGIVTLSAPLDYESASSHTLTIYASDGTDESHSDFTVNVINIDESASANLAVTGTAEEGGSLTASLTEVSDPDGEVTGESFQWQIFVDGAWTDIADANTATLHIPGDESYVGKNVRVIATVTDSTGGSTSFVGDAQTIANVNDAPSAPVDTDGASGATVSEFLAVGSTIGIDASSTDPEGSAVSYYFRDGGGAITQTLGAFTINAVTGVVTLASALNYELAPSHFLTIYAGDGTAESSSSFTVNVTNGVEHLFTAGDDSINFNLVPDGGYDLDGAEYDALEGNDFVILPDLTRIDAGHPWDFTHVFTAGTGNDTIVGGTGNDWISGGAGIDFLWGNDGSDLLDGGADHDFLYGGAGGDALLGGDGDDYLVAGDGDDTINGGSGWDRFSAIGATARITVDLTLQGSAQNTGQGMDTLIGIEHVSGTIFNDVITGDGGDNWLWGGSDGSGVTGNDTISGGGGNDLIEVGTGNHTLSGGSGNDTLSLHGNGTDITSAGVSVSLAMQGVAQATRQGTMLISGFENLSGSLFDDELIGDGSANILAGHIGNDTLRGGAGDDVLYGDGAIYADTHGLLGSGPIVTGIDMSVGQPVVPGDDLLEGGLGNDTLNGGGGTDTATYANAAGGVTVNLTAGTASGADGTDVLISIENVTGSGFADVLTGNAGANTLVGGGGNDRIIGAGGADTLLGGAGADTFAFNLTSDSAAASADIISDFSGNKVMGSNTKGKPTSVAGEGDRIDLSAIDANTLVAGNQAFILANKFTGVAGQAYFSYDSVANRTSIYLDTNGDKVADATIHLLGDVILSGTDFVL